MIAVLLVHDNTDLIDATRSYLERMGEVRVDSVNSTKQAIEVLKNRTYDVIVSYYHMPQVDGIEFVGDMNGVELLKYLKQNGNTTPFILYARNPGNKIVLEDINYASETVVGARTPLSELRDIIKQAVVRKRSEREQNSRYEMLNALLSATPLAISRVRNGKFDWVNTPMYSMFGYADGELSDKEMPVIFPGREEYDRACRELSIRIDGQGWGNSDTELRRKDGSMFNCHLRTRAVDPSDPAKGDMVIAEDTTERARLLEAVKQAEIKYRELVQDSQSIILKVDTEGTITFFNKAAQAFFGWSAAEVVGKSVVGTIVSPTSHSAKEVISMMGDLSRSGGEGGIHINENVLRGGKRYGLHGRINPYVMKPEKFQRSSAWEMISRTTPDMTASGSAWRCGKTKSLPVPMLRKMYLKPLFISAWRLPGKDGKEKLSGPRLSSVTPTMSLRSRGR